MNYINDILNAIIENMKNTNYSFGSMFFSWIVGLFSFNWVEKLFLHGRKTVKWIKEDIDKAKHKYYDLSVSSEYKIRCEIEIFSICDECGVDSENKKTLSKGEIEKYCYFLNEFLHYQMRLWDRNLESDFNFGLYHMIGEVKPHIRKKIKDIVPCIEKFKGEYVGVFKVKTYEKLSGLEIQEIREAIKNSLFDCFGESIEQMVVPISKSDFQLCYVYDDNFKAIMV